MAKTYEEINEKIKRNEAVVATAEEIIDIVEKDGLEKAAKEVDVVTTATFGPMCSSGAFINLGHSKPKIRIQKAWLNNISAYAGIAAVDIYIGATEIPENDPANNPYPGNFSYGGGHVIHDLIAGKDIHLKATSYGTDCYPRKEISTWINIKDLNQAYLFNPRNCYQNYNVAVNLSDKTIHTYLGTLKPNLGNIYYSSAGQLSPLLNDPYYKTIGIGTRVWLGGAQGYVSWPGTQHNPLEQRNEYGVPTGGAGTLALIGDMKKMDADYVIGASMRGYGVSLSVGVGIPIPILNEKILNYTTIKDEDIQAPVVDYSYAYPNAKPETLGSIDYKQLKSGKAVIKGKEVPASGLSSYNKALKIADILKKEIQDGKFLLSKPAELLPSVDSEEKFKPLNIKTR